MNSLNKNTPTCALTDIIKQEVFQKARLCGLSVLRSVLLTQAGIMSRLLSTAALPLPETPVV